MEMLYQRVRDIQEQLGVSAGEDPSMDRYRSGACTAYQDLINIEFGEVSDD